MQRRTLLLCLGVACTLLPATAGFAQRQAMFLARLDAQGQVSTSFEPDIVDRLESLGYVLTVVNDQWTTRADAAPGKDLLYIAESGGSANADPFKVFAIPAIMSEAFGWDNWDWATGTAAWVTTQTQITIVDPAHPLAAGLSGTVTVYNTPTDIQGKAVAELTAPGVHVVATIAGDPTQAVLVAVEKGGALLNGRFAPERQVGLFFGAPVGSTVGIVTNEGWRLFDAAIRWVDPFAPPSAPLNLTARPGDGVVGLEWDAPTSGPVDGYRVQRSGTTGGPYTEVTTTTLPQYTDTGLINGTPYYFVVRAFNVAGDGPPSNEASATPEAGVSLRARRWFKYD